MTLDTLAQNPCRVHFIGVGGAGIFPLVQIFAAQGHTLQGSDNNPGDTTQAEELMGVKVFIGHRAEQVAGAELVIYSAAIPKDNPELLAAGELGIPVFERAQVLGWLSKQYPLCIGVAGSHGKTSATAMLSQILVGAGLDPTCVIGGKLPLIGGGGRAGSGPLMAVEACEYKDTFLSLSCSVSIILNVDADHLEYFGDLGGVIRSFRQFAQNTSRLVIACGDDENTRAALRGLDKEVLTFGFEAGNDYTAENINIVEPTRQEFDLVFRGKRLARLSLRVPGRHNILNALAACAGALAVGATPAQLEETLPGFRGVGRRFEVLGKARGVTIADDYAHHPIELAATLKVAMEMGYRQVWAVFQPFTFSRTKHFLDGFAQALKIPHCTVLSAIMGGREQNTYDVHTRDLAEKIPGCVWFESFEEIAGYVMKNAQPGDLVLTLGCGDVYKCAKMMLGAGS
ncbi:MAG: UDP-N-acetylmuramate--L-alanine ligase [Oscillospiraceae bacterium]|nr:UDP-N-acetylmuramate--L-alanine ligase [Oscillospiraceae bacterium]